MSRTLIDLAENSDEPTITRGAAGKAPAHLGGFIDEEAEEVDEDEVCERCALANCRCAYDIDAQPEEEEELFEEDEGDEEILQHQQGWKRSLRCEEKYEDFRPDLAVYFAEFGLTEQQQIAMCRTYANYLAQKVRAAMKEKRTESAEPAAGKGTWTARKTGWSNRRNVAKKLKFN